MGQISKILVVASYCGPYGGNFIESLVAFENKAREKSLLAVYVFPDLVKDYEWARTFEQKDRQIYYIPYKPYSYDNLKCLRYIIRKENPSVIYSRMGGWDITSWLASKGIPVIWHLEYALNLDSMLSRVKYWVKYKIMGSNVYHIAVSEASTKAVNAFKPKHMCIVAPNALNLRRLGSFAMRWTKKDKYKVLLFAYDPITKGLDLALEAFERLNENGICCVLQISAQDRTYPFLQNRYRMIPEWVELLQPTDNIAEVYSRADIMLSASRHEGFSYCLAEAIYSGLPVVYSDIPGTSWAREFTGTYMFKSESVCDLQNAIRLCIDIGITENNVLDNRLRMQARYSMDAWAETVVKVVGEIIC